MANVDWYTALWLAEHEDELIGRFYANWEDALHSVQGPISSVKLQDDGSVVIKTAWAAKRVSPFTRSYELVSPLIATIPADATPYEYACRRRIIIVHGDQINPPMIRGNIEGRHEIDPQDVVDFEIRLAESA